MTDEQADELLRNNDWTKWSDARELVQLAAGLGAAAERRRLAAVEDQRDELLEALKGLVMFPLGTFQVEAARAAIAKAEQNT